jgi:hypothetical protein
MTVSAAARACHNTCAPAATTAPQTIAAALPVSTAAIAAHYMRCSGALPQLQVVMQGWLGLRAAETVLIRSECDLPAKEQASVFRAGVRMCVCAYVCVCVVSENVLISSTKEHTHDCMRAGVHRCGLTATMWPWLLVQLSCCVPGKLPTWPCRRAAVAITRCIPTMFLRYCLHRH